MKPEDRIQLQVREIYGTSGGMVYDLSQGFRPGGDRHGGTRQTPGLGDFEHRIEAVLPTWPAASSSQQNGSPGVTPRIEAMSESVQSLAGLDPAMKGVTDISPGVPVVHELPQLQ